ncbi:hypothetical protein Dimus_021918 [Dionaea muscipula]
MHIWYNIAQVVCIEIKVTRDSVSIHGKASISIHAYAYITHQASKVMALSKPQPALSSWLLSWLFFMFEGSELFLLPPDVSEFEVDCPVLATASGFSVFSDATN